MAFWMSLDEGLPATWTPRLTSMPRWLPCKVKSEMPVKAAKLALACKVVNWCEMSARSVAKSKPKSTPCSEKPSCEALPPLVPKKALTPLPPTDSVSAWMTSPSDSVRSCCLLSKAKLPCNSKKLKTFTSSVAAARSKGPLAPSMLSVSVLLAPVATSMLWGDQSSTLRLAATVSAWLICSSMFCALAVRPSTPVKLAEEMLACIAIHSRAVLLWSAATTAPKLAPVKPRPTASAVPPCMPMKPEALLAPILSRLAVVALASPCTHTEPWLFSNATSP